MKTNQWCFSVSHLHIKYQLWSANKTRAHRFVWFPGYSFCWIKLYFKATVEIQACTFFGFLSCVYVKYSFLLYITTQSFCFVFLLIFLFSCVMMLVSQWELLRTLCQHSWLDCETYVSNMGPKLSTCTTEPGGQQTPLYLLSLYINWSGPPLPLPSQTHGHLLDRRGCSANVRQSQRQRKGMLWRFQ